MRSEFLIIFALLCLAVKTAQSKTSIDSEDIINIGGHKLNGVTRRERTPAIGQIGYGSENDNDEEENSFIVAQYMSNEPSAYSTLTFAHDNTTDQYDYEEQADESNSDQQNVESSFDPQAVGSQPAPIAPNHTNNSNDIVLIQFDTPPKVDPLTHAVFELRPINSYIKDAEEEYDMDEVDPSSEGDNQSNGDNDKSPFSNIQHTRRRPRPKPNTFYPNIIPGQLGISGTKQKKKSNKKQANTHNKVHFNSLLRRRHSENQDMNRLPVKIQAENKNTVHRRATISPNGSNIRRKNQNKRNSGNKKLGNNVIKDIVTTTTIGLADGDRNVNYIFIEKSPTKRRTRKTTRRTARTTTTTTRRPFWRLFGRTAREIPDIGYGYSRFVV